VIATDSGGIQKESHFYRVPCVTLPDESECVELVEIGANRLCPPRSRALIKDTIQASVHDGFPENAPLGLYGNGAAAAEIAGILSNSDGEQLAARSSHD